MTLELLHKPSMAELTSLGIGGSARALAKVRDEAGLDELSRFVESERSALLAIGEGSNMLAGDGNLNLTLIQIDRAQKKEAEVSDNTVKVQADMRLPKLLATLIKKGLSGMEGLAGIPGSIGGSIAMNAGSYGTDIQSSVKRVRLWTPTKGLFWKDTAELEWGYRHFSADTNEFTLVWEAEFELTQSSENIVRDRIKETFSKKKTASLFLKRLPDVFLKIPKATAQVNCWMRQDSKVKTSEA